LTVTYHGCPRSDPNTGRFLTEDPIGLQGGINRYAYADDDPVGSEDPSGTDAWPKPAPVRPVKPAPPIKFPPPVEPLPIEPEPLPLPWWPIAVFVFNPAHTAGECQDTISGIGCRNKHERECTTRRNQEFAFCKAEYNDWPNLLRKCRSRASERWSACLRNLPDPGPLDPLDPTWSPD
jgi:hypothetical protein